MTMESGKSKYTLQAGRLEERLRTADGAAAVPRLAGGDPEPRYG